MIERRERISPAFRQLKDYVTADNLPDNVVNSFPQIDGIWNRLTPVEQKQYRQFLLRREDELNALLQGESAAGLDKTDCTVALKVVELMKTRINALQPPKHDTWWRDKDST
jgi:hypothetical protein